MIDLKNCLRPASGQRMASCGWLMAIAVAVSGVFWSVPGAWAKHNHSQHGQFSNANHLLFTSDQLGNIQPPKKLKYTYTVSGAPVNYKDHIDLDLRQGKKQGKDVHVDFLSGERHRYVPDIANAQGNPVIAVFLQHDVYTLARRSGGSWRYFQKRIKMALAHNATIKKGTAQYHGQSVDTTRISITPYANMTAHKSDMGKSLTERYVFTLSDKVPGDVLEIKSTVPGRNNTSAMVRKLRLASLTTLKPSKNKNNSADSNPDGSSENQ